MPSCLGARRANGRALRADMAAPAACIGAFMKVTDIEAKVVIQPLMDRDWKFARGQLAQTAALLLEVHTDEGVSGLGLAVQGLHLGEVLHGMEQVVSEQVAPLLVGRDPFDTEWVMTEIGRRVSKVGMREGPW